MIQPGKIFFIFFEKMFVYSKKVIIFDLSKTKRGRNRVKGAKNKMAKITKATVKSFIRKNFENLQINVKSSFDGMVDGCVSYNDGFTKAIETKDNAEYTLGVAGAWFVGGSRDYFQAWEDETKTGISVSNCCGHFILAVNK